MPIKYKKGYIDMRNFKKIIAGIVAILIATGATSAFAINKNRDSKVTSNIVKVSSETTTSESREASSGNVQKDETVYLKLKADGSTKKTIVSGWLKNPGALSTIEDVCDLKEIENVKGDEKFTTSDGKVTWDAKGKDIYYKGTSDKQAPVSVKITYTLDGKEISAEELAGKSGKVKIKYEFTSNKKVNETISGKKEEITLPYLMATTMIFDSDKFLNVEIDNGKIISDGKRLIVEGIAIPGLKESLKMDAVNAIPESFEVTADVKNFSLETSITLCTGNVLDLLNDDVKVNSDVFGSMSKLTTATNSLVAGSSKLSGGVSELNAKTVLLSSAITRLNAGSTQLASGTSALKSGTSQLLNNYKGINSGITKTGAGLNSLSAGIDSTVLKLDQTIQGNKQVLQGLKGIAATLPEGAQKTQLTATIQSYEALIHNQELISASMKSGNGGIKDGTTALINGNKQLSSGSVQFNNALATLDASAGQLNAGAKELATGLGQLDGQKGTLIEGIKALNNGAQQLDAGLQTFKKEGIDKIITAMGGDPEGLSQRITAIKKLSKENDNFSGVNKDMKSSVKYVFVTDSILAK